MVEMFGRMLALFFLEVVIATTLGFFSSGVLILQVFGVGFLVWGIVAFSKMAERIMKLEET